MDTAQVARFQIVQMYDNDWPRDLREAGHPLYADWLELFIEDQDSITDNQAIKLRDFMASATFERDGI
ncbi:MAG TPA: hypothetical protein PK129_01910 [Cellvibrionaceae bacterium]|nr:hypothetical protein [Cellvibrionaceae bacterium]